MRNQYVSIVIDVVSVLGSTPGCSCNSSMRQPPTVGKLQSKYLVCNLNLEGDGDPLVYCSISPSKFPALEVCLAVFGLITDDVR